MIRSARCADLLHLVDSSMLDCVSDDLALLLAQAGTADIRSPFAQDWRFELDTRPGELPRLALPPADQSDLLARRTGWRPRWHRTGRTQAPERWSEQLGHGRAVLVLADTWDLDWLPYAGHEHIVHGFVVDELAGSEVEVVDPYQNVTAWGEARPTVLRRPLDELLARMPDPVDWAVLEPAGQAEPPDERSQLERNGRAIQAAARAGTPAGFVAAHDGLDEPAARNLALQTWLLVRSRAYHAGWLADAAGRLDDTRLGAFADRFRERVVSGWRRAAESAYLAQRRVMAGRSVPRAVLGLVESVCAVEAELAAELTRSAVVVSR
jgi:hypothetical protein